MIKYILIAVGFLIGAMTQTIAEESLQLPDNVCILPSGVGNIMAQYSPRSGPLVTSYWMPAIKDVLKAEEDLPVFLKQYSPQHPHLPLSKFNRQYVGIICAGKKRLFIYSFQSDFAVGERQCTWKKELFVVKDGGDSVWRVDYDIETRTFYNLNFNGDA